MLNEATKAEREEYLLTKAVNSQIRLNIKTKKKLYPNKHPIITAIPLPPLNLIHIGKR